MHELYELKEKLMKELGEYSQRGGYAYDDGNQGGNMGGNRGGGYSRNMGGSYRDGRGNSYARGRGQNARRDSMGRYSRGGDMVEQLEDLKQDAPNDQIRQQIQQLISQVEQMM